MKKNWVDPANIIVVQSPTLDDFMSRKDDIDAIYGANQSDDFWSWAPNYFPFFWMFYLKEGDLLIPVGIIRRDFFTRSVIIHGTCREGYQAKGIEYYGATACLNNTFLNHKFTKVMLPIPEGNKGVIAFAQRWGFEKTDYKEGNETYWRLKREKFMERLKKDA